MVLYNNYCGIYVICITELFSTLLVNIMNLKRRELEYGMLDFQVKTKETEQININVED